ncbi:hypothetical protein T12_11193 [Trichinella patagoniensis]|uniref:Uncharacterized protein n=1 Tax=Trichinella patagoniensis TaxID=990121 RepID=A0A0V1AAB0_9BILA|nr:hypothetical protein T12_11193 [Trichinella patagoniensis]
MHNFKTECQHKQQWSDFHNQAPLLFLFPFAAQWYWKGGKIFYEFEERIGLFQNREFPPWLYRPVESTDAICRRHVLLVGHFNGYAGPVRQAITDVLRACRLRLVPVSFFCASGRKSARPALLFLFPLSLSSFASQ